MGFEMGGVDHQPMWLTSLARQLGENLVEHAKTAPAHKPVVVGDSATWKRPAGDKTLEITKIEY